MTKRQPSGIWHYLETLRAKLRAGGGLSEESAEAIALDLDEQLELQRASREARQAENADFAADLLEIAMGVGDREGKPPQGSS